MKHYKNIITVVFAILISSISYSQLKVLNDGSVDIKSHTGNWGRAVRTTVYYPNSCAYHLTYGHDRFYVNAHGWLWAEQGGYFGSDLKLKKNITSINNPLKIINQLNGIKFMFKNDSLSTNDKDYLRERLGFIAQDVEKVLPGIVRTIPQNNTKAIAYTDLIPLLVEGIKEQQKQIETLQKIVYSQEKRIVELKSSINTKNQTLNQNDDNLFNDVPKLFNNIPNPFNSETIIKFYIPKTSTSAMLIITDLQGKEVKSFNIQAKGNDLVKINSSELYDGMFIYTLLVDDKIIDTKKMMLRKK